MAFRGIVGPVPASTQLDLRQRLPAADPLVPTVFHSPWWLDVVGEGEIRTVEVRADHRVVARMSFAVQRGIAGFRLCGMPELTHFLGPAIDLQRLAPANRALKDYRLTQELLAQLTPFDGIYQKLHRGGSYTLAFEEKGFSTSVSFTYEIEPRPATEIWNDMRDKTRNVIRRANDQCVVLQWDDPQAFSAFYNSNLEARGLSNHYTRIAAVCEQAIARRQGLILAAKNKAGEVMGAIFIIWDHETAYYLMSTWSAEADNGVISLLIWEAIRLVADAGLLFDFDGLGTPGSRVFFTGFGGKIVPRFVVRKNSFRYRGLSAADRLARRWLPRGKQSRPAVMSVERE